MYVLYIDRNLLLRIRSQEEELIGKKAFLNPTGEHVHPVFVEKYEGEDEVTITA